VVSNQPTFHPAILLQLTCTPSPKQWLKLWPAQGKLSSMQVLAPQSSPSIDLLPLVFLPINDCYQTPFHPSFLFPHVSPDLHDLLTCNSPLDQRLSLTPPFRPLGVSTLNSTLLCVTISWSGRSIATCPLESMARISSMDPAFGDLKSQVLFLLLKYVRILPCVLLNQMA
jgi:hypothetical protein